MLKNWIHHFALSPPPPPLSLSRLFIKKNTCKIGRECTAIFHNIKSSRQSFRSSARFQDRRGGGGRIEVEGVVRALPLNTLFNPLSRRQTLICLTYEREPPFPKYTRSRTLWTNRARTILYFMRYQKGRRLTSSERGPTVVVGRAGFHLSSACLRLLARDRARSLVSLSTPLNTIG